MDRFSRYVLYQLSVAMVLVTVGLTSMIWLMQSVRLVDMIVNRGLTAGTFFYLTMLVLPNFLPIVLPIAMFTVVVFIYNKLIADHEVVVMRAAGFSQYELAKPAILLAIGVMVLGYLINIFLLPQSYQMFKELKWDIRYSYSHILLQEGTFNNVANNITVYVRTRTKEGELLGIFVHDTRVKDKPFTLLAERGAMIKSKNGSRVMMLDGSRHEIDKKTNKMSILYFDKYIIDLKGEEVGRGPRSPEARELLLSELFRIEDNKLVGVRDHGKYTVEAHRRLTSPVSALAFTLIGLACLMTRYHQRSGRTRQILIAVAVFVTFLLSQLALENAAAKNLTLVPLLYVNMIMPIVVGAMVIAYSGMRRSLANARAAVPVSTIC